MINRKSLIVLATALSIGAGTFTAAAPANAASNLGFATLEHSVDATVMEVGRKGGKRHRGHRLHWKHGKQWKSWKHRRHWRWGHSYYGAYFGYGCFYKTFKRWDPYEAVWIFYKRRFCY